MRKVTILKISTFYQFWNNSSNITAANFTIFFFNQKLSHFLLLLMQNNGIEFKSVYCFIYLIKQSFHFFFGDIKIIMNHFLQVSSFRLIAIYILIYYVSNVLDCMNIVYSLILCMMLNTAFCLTNSAGAGAC